MLNETKCGLCFFRETGLTPGKSRLPIISQKVIDIEGIKSYDDDAFGETKRNQGES